MKPIGMNRQTEAEVRGLMDQPEGHRDEWNEQWLLDSLSQRILQHWRTGTLEPNWFDVIASMRGWHPLSKSHEMTVHIDGKEYVVKRTK